jgi:hypothetical protein
MPAAKAAEAAGEQGKFWEIHDKLFENNKAMTEENFVKRAGEIGEDVEKFKKDMADPKVAAISSKFLSTGMGPLSRRSAPNATLAPCVSLLPGSCWGCCWCNPQPPSTGAPPSRTDFSSSCCRTRS